MAYRTHDDESWNGDDDGSANGGDTIPCPHCRRAIHEDSQRCPYCENYISEEDSPPRVRPWWFVAGVLLCLVIVLTWIVSG